MRLSLYEAQCIVESKNKFFGKNSQIYLFGSRADDSKKGGDIVLYISRHEDGELFNKKIAFLADIQEKLGEQKIDVIFEAKATEAFKSEVKSKGVELDIESLKLQKYFDECDKHLQRIEEAYEDIAPILPITASSYKTLGKREVQALDQYLYRFSKLQDTLGDKIFRALIKKYEQNDEVLAFMDVLNKLEKIGFLDSAKEWITLRKIRNEISHQYDDEPKEAAQAINAILSQKKALKAIYANVK